MTARQHALSFSRAAMVTNSQARENYRQALTNLLLLRDKLILILSACLNVAYAHKNLGEFIAGAMTATLDPENCNRLIHCVESMALAVNKICEYSRKVTVNGIDDAFDTCFIVLGIKNPRIIHSYHCND